jgi:sulfate-transporting ATPase
MSPSDTSAGCLLQARQLTAGYGAVPVVRGLDIELNAGEVTVLLGPNGAGKSTTIMTLAGLLPSLGGEVLLGGALTTAPLHQRAQQGLGLVSEERAVLMQLTVAENLRVSRGDAELALRLFPELEQHIDRKVGMLSGGQQQMLALARALARRPTVLLADELSLGLAPMVVDRLLKAVRAAADDGVAVLLVEQHIHKALKIADRGHVMRRGRLVLSGGGAEMRARAEEIQEMYISAIQAQPPGSRAR